MNAVDLFAGAGGFTTGARMAGLRVAWAANHWRAAVDTHEANHPDTDHKCQDLQQADWGLVPPHDVLLASPACQGHSPARGKDRPHHDASRSTAWAVVECAEHHRPPFVVVENVPQFLRWVLFPAWHAAMRALGYSLAPTLVDAADHGVPQHRQRVFIVCTRSAHPMRLALPKVDHVAIANVIDFDAGRWSRVHKPGRARSTLARIERGRRDHGARFVMPYYSRGSGLTGRSVDRPLGTVTTRDRWALVDGDRMRMFSVPEYRRAMSFPDDYALPSHRVTAIHLLGNAVPPIVARDVLRAIAL